MYHKISETPSDSLTVSPAQLEEHLTYLVQRGYNTLFFKDLKFSRDLKKKIIITFDDGYDDNRLYLEPLLQKLGLKATIFIVTDFINNEGIMSFDKLRNLDRHHIEIALHSHYHRDFTKITAIVAEKDLRRNMAVLEDENIPYTKAFAYPYGHYPRSGSRKEELFCVLRKLGILYAVRIGNRNNIFPTETSYEICRIGIENRDGIARFRRKLFWGKLKLF